jgi:hypothetical protein
MRSDVPVALFAYSRPRQLEAVLAALRVAGVDKLYVFSDAPADATAEEGVRRVREILRGITWTQPTVVERGANLGLSASVRAGLDAVFSEHDRAVVVEDDIRVAPEFYRYAVSCLERFAADERVAAVTGLRYPFDRSPLDESPYDVFFTSRFCSWGWATWRRAWERMDFDESHLVERLRRNRIEIAAAGDDLLIAARQLMRGTLRGGWDVYCALSVLADDSVVAWPTWNMIENLGFEEGTHVGEEPPTWQLAWETQFATDPSRLTFPHQPVKNGLNDAFLRFFAGRVPSDRLLPRAAARLGRVVRRSAQ